MRQVVKDRLGRIDEQIARLQELYKTATKESLRKNFLYEIQRLCEKKDDITNKEIFGTIRLDKYQRGLEDRKAKLDDALEERNLYTEDIVLAMQEIPVDVARITRLKNRLGNCNRIVAIYQNSLDSWIRRGANSALLKKAPEVPSAPAPTLSRSAEREIATLRGPIDDEIVGYINRRSANNEAKDSQGSFINNATNIEMITRPEERKDLRIKTLEELRAENPGLSMPFALKVTPTTEQE